MKIMNADGTYNTVHVSRIPTNPEKLIEEKYSKKYLNSCAKLLSSLRNLEHNKKANVARTCTRIIQALAILTKKPQKTINHNFNHFLAFSEQVTVKNRVQYFKNLCQKAQLNIPKIKKLAHFHNKRRGKILHKEHLQTKLDMLRMDREGDSELFFNSYEHIEYGHLLYELKTGQTYHSHKAKRKSVKHKKNKIIEPQIRVHLKHLGNKKRYRFIGTFVRSGFKSTFHGNGLNRGDCYAPTLLFKNVKLFKNKNNKVITHHLWLNYTKGFRKLGQLKPNDNVVFNARVNTYWKGYTPLESKSLDYSLSFPTKIKRNQSNLKRLPMPVDDKNALLGYIMQQNKDFYLANDRPYDDWYVEQYNQWKCSYR